jgi:hypothetical protein
MASFGSFVTWKEGQGGYGGVAKVEGAKVEGAKVEGDYCRRIP